MRIFMTGSPFHMLLLTRHTPASMQATQAVLQQLNEAKTVPSGDRSMA
jgi:hypothetical protein